MTALLTRCTTRPAAQIPFADCWITDAARHAAETVMASGWATTGPQELAFEREFAAAVDAGDAVAVSSCTAALELSLRALHLPARAAVLVPANTFCGAVHAIEHAGLRAVLVDVDPLTGMPDEATTRYAASSWTPAAMVVLHFAGDPSDVTALAHAAGLPLSRIVVDAAHALGATWYGRPIGAGAAVCFSFYATKNLPIGEGGMVTTDDPETAAWIRSARLHGMSADAWQRYLPGGSFRYDVLESGLKANMTDVQAAVGRHQLRSLAAWQERRTALAARYDAQLAGVPGIDLPHRPDPRRGTHAWHLYPVRVGHGVATTRDEVASRLCDAGIGTSVHFPPVHRLTHFHRSVAVPPGGLPGADALFEHELSLPLYPRLTEDQVDRVCDALRTAVHATGATR
ncbi:MAG: DegT/DnrJ/EryC1/StrS family aminotransferase [Marmoricola sp.]